MGDTTLEQRLADWLHGRLVGGVVVLERDRADLHRILQLARREGYMRRAGATNPYVNPTAQAEARVQFARIAREEYPLPPVTRTEQRVEPDPHGDGEWLIRDGAVVWAQPRTGYHVAFGLWLRNHGDSAMTAQRCRLWADLRDEPTKQVEVEDDDG